MRLEAEAEKHKKIEEFAVKQKEAREQIDGYILEDGKQINVIAEGKLVNIAASSLASIVVILILSEHYAWLATLIVTVAVIIFAALLIGSIVLIFMVSDKIDSMQGADSQIKLAAQGGFNCEYSEAQKLYINSGNEVAVHTLTHPFLEELTETEKAEIERMEAIKDKRHQQYILRKQRGSQQRWEKAYEPRRKERIAQLKAENPNTYGIPAEEYDQEHYSRMSVVLADSVVPDF